MSATTASWVISLGVSGAAALAFVIAALATGESDGVALAGGATWVFLLSVIILLPTVMPWLRERQNRP
jgi:hypothetical protein